MDLKAVAGEGNFTIIAHSGGDEVVLNIGVVNTCGGTNEAATFKMIGGAEAGFQQHPFRTNHAF